jgi:serine/threonine protein kinase
MLWDNEIMLAQDSLIGRNIASFRIERLLGRGGMASVYFAFDTHLERPAALKVIDNRFRNDPAFSERFLREARAMASWRHPNIPQIYQSGIEDGINFYAMEYIHGMDLEKLLIKFSEKGEVLTYADVLQIGRAVADALDYAHQRGAIHRDVKTANVMISDDDRILLTDFGLVLEVDKGTRGEVFGSPHYIAPEQAKNSAGAVPQSDLYSLGVMLYEMLVGTLPFTDESPASLALKHISQEPPLPTQVNHDLCPEIETVLLKILRKDPRERYKTGKELMDALESAVEAQAVYEETGTSFTLLPTDFSTLAGEKQTQPRPTVSQLRAADIVAQNLNAQPQTLVTLDGASPPPTQRFIPSIKDRFKFPVLSSCSISILVSVCIFLGFGTALAARWASGLQERPAQIWGSITAPGLHDTITAVYNSTKTHLPTTPLSTEILFGEVLTASPTRTLPTPTSSQTPSPTVTPSPTLTSSPSQTPYPTMTPSTTPTPFTEYNLLLIKQKDDGFFLINEGRTTLPLKFLEFRRDKFKFPGEEWEINDLKPGECVAAWSSDGRVSLPKSQDCNQVGDTIRLSSREKFWTSDIEIYYNAMLVVVCKKNRDCNFLFRGFP